LGLPAWYWSAALLHAAYLHNGRVQRVTKTTPVEEWFNQHPNLKHLRTFGSRVCIKQSGERRAKLDHHHFDGIFIGYTATDHNIRYIDIVSGVVKQSHHAVFNKAWYLQPSRPLAAQLLYDLSLQDDNPPTVSVPAMLPSFASQPPCPKKSPDPASIGPARHPHLPLCKSATPNKVTAWAATASILDPYHNTLIHFNHDAAGVTDYQIHLRDIAQIFMSPTAYDNAFEEYINMKCFYPTNLPVGDLQFRTIGDFLILGSIAKSSPCAKLKDWQSCLKGAWLIQVNGIDVHTVADVNEAFNACLASGLFTCTLLFSHPEVRHRLTNKGIPQVTLDQLNLQLLFDSFTAPQLPTCKHSHICKVWDSKVLHYVTRAQRLTRGHLIKQDDWQEWNSSEFTQLNQYEAQGMFGSPQHVSSDNAVFNLVWTYKRAWEIVLKTKLRWYRRRGSVGADVVVKVQLLPYDKP
jgi:hypothetical protein